MSALKSGMDRKTARKYLAHPELLSQPRPARDWRTRPDTLTAIWPEAELRLSTAPELEAKALFGCSSICCWSVQSRRKWRSCERFNGECDSGGWSMGRRRK
jgi:hypothetical protein